MTYIQFKKMHLVVDWESNKATLKDLVIKNVKTGKEALDLSSLFNLNDNSILHSPGATMSGFPHTEDYISFINIGGKSFVSVGKKEHEHLSVQVYWYDETIKSYCEMIMQEYDLSNDSDVKAMYEAFGMEVQDEGK